MARLTKLSQRSQRQWCCGRGRRGAGPLRGRPGIRPRCSHPTHQPPHLPVVIHLGKHGVVGVDTVPAAPQASPSQRSAPLPLRAPHPPPCACRLACRLAHPPAGRWWSGMADWLMCAMMFLNTAPCPPGSSSRMPPSIIAAWICASPRFQGVSNGGAAHGLRALGTHHLVQQGLLQVPRGPQLRRRGRQPGQLTAGRAVLPQPMGMCRGGRPAPAAPPAHLEQRLAQLDAAAAPGAELAHPAAQRHACKRVQAE